MSRRDTGGVAYADTNLFVALFATDEHPSHDTALEIFRRVADGTLRLIVAPLIVAELVYVTTSVLRWNRATVAERLTAMLEADGLDVREADVLVRSFALYRDVRRMDFADAYLAAAALEIGPPIIASFDADADLVEGVTRIKQ
jgi:predicted nucleic acid-binding protein